MEQPHYSTQPHYMGHPLKEIPHPHPHDVLCGRGGGTNAHIGNSHWRMLVAANKELYCSLPKKQKMLLSKSIVNAVRSQNPPGRFLQKDSHSELWYDVGDQRATEKTSQALREGAPEIRTKLKEPAKGTGGSATTGPSTTPAATTASTPPTPVQPVASSSSASSYRSVPQPPQGAPQPPPPPMRPMVPTSSGLYVPAPPHHMMPPLVDRHSSGLALPAPVPAQGPVPQRSRSKKMESSSSGGASSSGGPSSGPSSSGAPGPSSQPPQPYPQQEHPQHAHHQQHPSQQQYQHHHQQPRYPSAQQAPPPPQHYPPPPYQKQPQQQQQPYPPRQGQYDFEPMPFHPVDSSVPALRQEASQQQNQQQQQQQQHMRPPVHTPNPSQFGSYREPSQPSYEETGANAGGAAFPEPPTGLDDNGGFSFGSIVMTDAEEMRLRQNYSLGTGTAPKRPSGSEPPGNHNNPASSAMSNNNNGNSHSDKQDRDAAMPTTVAPPDGGLQDIGTSFGSMMSIGTAPKLDANGGFSFGSAMSFSVNAAAVTAVDGGLEAIGTSFGSLSLATNDRQRMLGDNHNKHTNDDDDDEAAAGAVPTFLQQHKSKGNLLDCTDSEDSDQEESASAAAASRNKSLEYEKLKATLEERKYAPATMMPPPLIGGGGPTTTTTTTTSRSSHSYYGAPPTHSLNIPAPSFDRDFSQMSAISVGDDDFQHYPPVIPYAGGGASGADNSNNGFSSDMPPPPPAMRKGDADDVWRDDSGDLEPF